MWTYVKACLFAKEDKFLKGEEVVCARFSKETTPLILAFCSDFLSREIKKFFTTFFSSYPWRFTYYVNCKLTCQGDLCKTSLSVRRMSPASKSIPIQTCNNSDFVPLGHKHVELRSWINKPWNKRVPILRTHIEHKNMKKERKRWTKCMTEFQKQWKTSVLYTNIVNTFFLF